MCDDADEVLIYQDEMEIYRHPALTRMKQRRRDTGSIEPPVHRVPPPRLFAYTDQIRSLGKQRPDADLRELREALDVPPSLPSLCRALQRLRLTVKKSPPRRPSRIRPKWRPYGRNG